MTRRYGRESAKPPPRGMIPPYERGDPGWIGTEPQVPEPRWYTAVFWGLIFATACFLGVLVWANMTTPPRPRLTCPDGYALVSNFGSKAYCAPGLVEPVRR